jgi:hypothetical protein
VTDTTPSRPDEDQPDEELPVDPEAPGAGVDDPDADAVPEPGEPG